MITQSRLKELFYYNDVSGIFTYLVDNAMKRSGDVAGSTDAYGYKVLWIDSRMYKLHRLAWLYIYGEFPKKYLDHIDGDRSNNSIKNLREASDKQNAQNMRKAHKDNSTNSLGVFFRKDRQKFCAQICVDGIKRHLGLYKTEAEASEAYIQAKRELHDFCTL